MLTWFVVSAAGSDYSKTAGVLYPLQHVYREVWPESPHLWHLVPFSIIAVCGMTASYNGMMYAVSRQSFALGRAGYLPRVLGRLHPVRRTPDVSIAVWSLVIAGFVLWGFFNESAIIFAVLTCNLTALIWYILAMVCLFVLRVREPDMPRPFKVPFYPFLPALVILLSLVSVLIYGWLQQPIVIWLTILMYGVGIGYFLLFARGRIVSAAPEELSLHTVLPPDLGSPIDH
jgi:ethanolamine permease